MRRLGARLASIVAAACVLYGCNPQAPKSSPSPSGAPSASASPKGLDLHITGQGTPGKPVHVLERQPDNRVEYDLTADRAESNGRTGYARVVFTNARIVFHDKNGSTLSATAPQAIFDQARSTLTLVGGVNARAANGMTLSCRQLEYDHADQTLHGTGNVVIIDPKGFRGTGNRFDSDISLTHYRMQ
jgi:LPS export ABC transporter protein LptC